MDVGLADARIIVQRALLMRRVNSLEKTPILGEIEGGRRRGDEDEMVGWHHRCNGREFE